MPPVMDKSVNMRNRRTNTHTKNTIKGRIGSF